MAALSVGWAPGERHCIHVEHVAGPFGVMTTIAVYWRGCWVGFCCWARAAEAAPIVAMQASAPAAIIPRYTIIRCLCEFPNLNSGVLWKVGLCIFGKNGI